MSISKDFINVSGDEGASYEEVMAVGQQTLTQDDVLEGVPELIGTIKIECLFGDGMRVLHVEHPIGTSQARAS